MTHSPEPWKVYDKCDQLIDGTGRHFLDLQGIRVVPLDERGGCRVKFEEADRDDLRRIAACVNFCKDISTELLERREMEDEVMFVNGNPANVIVPVTPRESESGFTMRAVR